MSSIPIRTEYLGGEAITVFSERRRSMAIARDVAMLKSAQNDDSAFYVMDIQDIDDSVEMWRMHLPDVEPLFPLACNTDPVLLRTLADYGIGFVVNSRQHVDLALDLVDSERIFFSNPCLTRTMIKHVANVGLSLITVDCEDDLHKIALGHPEARVLLRIATASYCSQRSIGAEFGCDPFSTGPALLRKAVEMGILVIGLSFQWDESSVEGGEAVMAMARELFDEAFACGHPMSVLDIGVAWTSDATLFSQSSALLRHQLRTFFSLSELPFLRVFAEAGSFLASSVFTLCTSIVSAEPCDASLVTDDEFDRGSPAFLYQTNEGLFGPFACRLAGESPSCQPLFPRPEDEHSSLQTLARVMGPSSDTMDVVQALTRFRPLAVGDWLIWPRMGAYTESAGKSSRPVVFYFAGHSDWSGMQERSRSTSPDRRSTSEDSDLFSDLEFFFDD